MHTLPPETRFYAHADTLLLGWMTKQRQQDRSYAFVAFRVPTESWRDVTTRTDGVWRREEPGEAPTHAMSQLPVPGIP